MLHASTSRIVCPRPSPRCVVMRQGNAHSWHAGGTARKPCTHSALTPRLNMFFSLCPLPFRATGPHQHWAFLKFLIEPLWRYAGARRTEPPACPSFAAPFRVTAHRLFAPRAAWGLITAHFGECGFLTILIFISI